MTEGILAAVLFALCYFPVYFRLPAYLVEAPLSALLSVLPRISGIRYTALARFLPFRHHELIYVELPGLRSFLIGLGKEDEGLAQEMIAEASASLGQSRAARLALFELETESLTNAARQRLYTRMAELSLPFLSRERAQNDPAVGAIQAAAEDLRACSISGNHLHRRRALDRARKSLHDAQRSITLERGVTRQARGRLATLRVWIEVVAEEEAELARAEAAQPQVPIPFIAGPALGPGDGDLFKGRQDLVRIIDHDLTGRRRAPILLVGQRRMGKSSLLNMLPIQLGTGTRVVQVNFQGLSGAHHRSHPEVWIAETIMAGGSAARELPPCPDVTAPWGETLDWLRSVDRVLQGLDENLLVALDEVERLEDGIREGWATRDFLDFLRAAGDALSRVRFLLATAYPLPRLGPHWVDRLINVLSRQIRPLTDAEAESLIREPMPGFPDIYPADGVEAIVAATAGHPYLIQLVCDTLCRHLNREGRARATSEDVERAVDGAVLETPLFHELWRQRTEDERRVLLSLAAGESMGDGLSTVARSLESEGYLCRREGELVVTVPMFREWLAETSPSVHDPNTRGT